MVTRWLALLVLGALAGLAALGLELHGLAYGRLAAGDWTRLLASHLVGGGVAGLIVGLLVRGLGRRPLGGAGLLLSALGLALLAVGFARWNTRAPCDVVLLVSDATRADHLSLYGYERPTAPELEAIAAEGVVWETMLSAGSSTIVSTPSILSALFPTQHGMAGHSNVLADSVRLISQHMEAAGYDTYGHTTNPHLKGRQGFARGYDVYNEKGGWEIEAEEVFATYLHWYLSRASQAPVFAFLFVIDPHAPYAPPPEYQTRFDPDWEKLPVASFMQLRRYGAEFDPRARENLIAQYDGEIAFMDACIGRFWRALERIGARENTLFVYTSDHGEEFFEHRDWGHNSALYEESIHVPLLVYFPSPLRLPRIGPRGVRVPGPVSHVDILPTILAYAGLPIEGVPNGVDLWPTIGRQQPDETRWVYCEEILEDYGPFELRAIRGVEWKYIRNTRNGDQPPRPEELYRLSEDPGERVNVHSQYPATARRLAEMLASRLARLRLSAPDSTQTIELDAGTREDLRSLGYIE